jgi:hypothetical protein
LDSRDLIKPMKTVDDGRRIGAKRGMLLN